MPEDMTEYQTAVLAILNDAFAAVVLACALVVFLLSIQIVRHW